MAVPKMVKNGNNSLFTIHNRFCYPFGIHAPKLTKTPKEELKPFYTNLGTDMRATFSALRLLGLFFAVCGLRELCLQGVFASVWSFTILVVSIVNRRFNLYFSLYIRGV